MVSTIEVKSYLDKKALKQAMEASKNSKNLMTNITRPMSAGYIPPKILNYVVSYAGPTTLNTVHNWIAEICEEMQITYPEVSTNPETRLQTASPTSSKQPSSRMVKYSTLSSKLQSAIQFFTLINNYNQQSSCVIPL